MMKIMGGIEGDNGFVVCTTCTSDSGCDASHICDNSSSCNPMYKVCVLRSRRECLEGEFC